MKRKKLLGVIICISFCFNLSGCSTLDNMATTLETFKSSIKSAKDNIAGKKASDEKTEETLNKEADDLKETSDSYEAVSLSDRDKKILTNLFERDLSLKHDGITHFVSQIVIHDDILKFDKTAKSQELHDAITPELAMQIAHDALGTEYKKEDFKLNDYGNIDLVYAVGETVKVYINKAVKTGEETYKINATEVYYPVQGAGYQGSYVFEVKKNSESMFGYTIVDFEKANEENWKPDSITASSTLKSDRNNTYAPGNLMDKNLSTAWAEGANGTGSDEYVLFESSKPQIVSGAFIDNGYLKSDDLLLKNCSVVRAKFEFSDGTIVESDLDPAGNSEYYRSSDNMHTNYINFGKEIETTSIKMTIIATTFNRLYEDTCVSEIKFIK